MVRLEIIGTTCKNFRRGLGYNQKQVASDTGYSVENISLFERGKNDNLKILLWYIKKGLPLNEVLLYDERI